MPAFRDIAAQLRRRFFPKHEVTLRFRTDARTACYIIPLIEKLLANDEDGETYQCAVAHWHHAERPPLDYFQGTSSVCRIDGPLQDAPAGYPEWCVPLGGLIETPGATGHLTPFEASALWKRIQEAIERVIVGWAKEHQLYCKPPVPSDFDRGSADRAAMALIASWTPASMAQLSIDGSSDHG